MQIKALICIGKEMHRENGATGRRRAPVQADLPIFGSV
jgi:hypothetical protein